jgi:dCTP deaminase
MVLSNEEIWDELAYTEFDVAPLTPEQVQPASVDLRLGEDFTVYSERPQSPLKEIDSRDDRHLEIFGEEREGVESILIEPDKFYLGTTVESINLPPHLYGKVAGRSSVGRLGVEVHKTAGVVDPGWCGELTLEITTDMPVPVRLYPGQRVAQMTVHKLEQPADPAYGEKEDEKYQNQQGPTESRISQDKDQ